MNPYLKSTLFAGKCVLITAGPTREALDPVRYISNHSTGKMGYALAEAFLESGASVILISGPVDLMLAHENLTLIRVESAADMFSRCSENFGQCDIALFTAAVADYRPEIAESKKIKKTDDTFTLKMVRNIDIASEFGKIKKPGQFSIGFALETDNELENARLKLDKKNFDLIILNSTNDAGATFGYDTNKITIIDKTGYEQQFDLKLKSAIAIDILHSIGVYLKLC